MARIHDHALVKERRRGRQRGGLYLMGALANLWGTRGRHPGWMLMAAALVLIVVGVTSPS